MELKITTWNVNSIRKRLDHLGWLVDAENPDVLCLQETKVVDRDFPELVLRALGYEHVLCHGQKSYNGVAIASRFPLHDPETYFWGGREEARHLSAVLHCATNMTPIEIHNLYIPAGGDKPDPLLNSKFAYKLDYLSALAHWWLARTAADQSPMVLVGDLNVAPLESDVWDHQRLRRVVTHTEIEIAHLEQLRRAGRWVDAVRHFHPDDEKIFSWWSYRAAGWDEADKGRRLDHIWVTPPLVPALTGASLLREARDWREPSDHVPVSVTLSL
ncbi:exodeoxyribonuclease III [Magnetospira thiophila]